MTTSTRFFSDDQRELVARVLDRIIPSNDRMPSGGEIAVDFLDGFAGSAPHRKRLFGEGLMNIEAEASRVYSRAFQDLTGDQQDQVLKQVEAGHPAFFDQLVRQTYNGYYTNPRVVELLGLETRPPQPMGYRVEMGDFSSIERVKQRGGAYREV